MGETISDFVKKKKENVEICSVPQSKKLFGNEQWMVQWKNF